MNGAVECDNCLDDFEPKVYETRVKGGAWQRFACPHCLHIYNVAFVTTAGLKLRAKIKAARDPEQVAVLQQQYREQVLRERPAA